MIYFFCSLYHYEKNTNPASDYTTGYMTGELWSIIAKCGIFDQHGNHITNYCGSQTTIIITATVMVEQLLFLSMDVYIVLIGVVFFRITM